MKQFFLIGLALILILFQKNSYSQITIEKPESAKELIDKGVEKYDKEKYDEALAFYQKVHSSDPLYPTACYEMAMTYYQKNELKLAVDKCLEALSYDYDDPLVYSLLGSVYDDMGRTQDGVNVILPALQKWPYNQKLLYNLALCYLRLQEYDKAEKLLLKTIRIYPYHTRSHLLLAKANYGMGRIAQSYLAMNMALLMNPSINYLKEFDGFITGKADSIVHQFDYPYANRSVESRWNNLKWALQSELVFNKDYKFNHKIDNIVTRQTQLLFQKAVYDPSDTSMYNQYYVRLFNKLMNDGLYETYIYYMFQNANNDVAKEWNLKNKTKISDFISWVQNNINLYRGGNFNPSNEKQNLVYNHYNNNGVLTALGLVQYGKDTIRQGLWKFVTANGGLSEQENYLNGLIQGECKVFWDNGNLKQLLYFKDNKLDGTCTTFYQDGTKSGVYNFKDGKREGEVETYTTAGLIQSTEHYKEGSYDGDYKGYSYPDCIETRLTYKNGLAQGERTKDWFFGVRASECYFIDDSIQGHYKGWHENGKLKYEGEYLKDKPVGLWKYYYWNGNLQNQGMYDSLGNSKGKWEYYYPNGKKYAVEESYKKGVLTGNRTEYYQNGQISNIVEYLNDKLQKLTFYDTTGKQLYSAGLINDKISYKVFYPDGSLNSEGDYSSDKKREGVWKFYNPIGILMKEFNYSVGMLKGEQRTYYSTGQLKEKYSCDSDKIDGLYKEYFVNGNLKRIGWMSKGKNVGEWQYFYRDGVISSKAYYNDGIEVGFYYSYSHNGKLDQSIQYDENGVIKKYRYYDVDGNISKEFKLNNGNGKILLSYSNGKPKLRCKYQMGEFTDTIFNYYKNGNKASQIVYLNGKLNGLYKRWDVNGKLSFEGNYILGSADGLFKYYEDGVLIQETNYQNDKEIGFEKYYYGNGKLYKLMNYVDGSREGYTYYYSSEGILLYRAFFIDGEIKSYSYKDATNNFVKEIPMDANSTQLVAYYPNGKVSAKLNFAKGNLEGKRFDYFSNGKISRESEFLGDEFVGVDRAFYISGQTWYEAHYYYGKLNGKFTFYYENGKVRSEGNYVMDSKDGVWKYYDINGKLVNEVNYREGELVD